MPQRLVNYIILGGGVGLFFGGVWQGISAMVLIWMATRLEYFIRLYERNQAEPQEYREEKEGGMRR